MPGLLEDGQAVNVTPETLQSRRLSRTRGVHRGGAALSAETTIRGSVWVIGPAAPATFWRRAVRVVDRAGQGIVDRTRGGDSLHRRLPEIEYLTRRPMTRRRVRAPG